MMQLPKELQGLEEPKYVSTTPAVVQYCFLITVLLVATGVYAWIGYSLLAGDGITWVQAVLGAIFVLGLVVALSPRNWQKWADFACDRNGVYVRKLNYGYVFKPWKDVGGFYIGKVLYDDGSGKGIIVRIRISEEESKGLFGNYPWPNLKIDEEGYTHIGISDGFKSNDDFIESVERVRVLSGAPLPD